MSEIISKQLVFGKIVDENQVSTTSMSVKVDSSSTSIEKVGNALKGLMNGEYKIKAKSTVSLDKNNSGGEEDIKPLPPIEDEEEGNELSDVANNWEHNEKTDGTLELTKSLKANSDGTLVIPSIILFEDGSKKTVTSIKGADDNPLTNKEVRTVIISEGIEEISNNSFIDCSQLTNIVLPSTLKKIGEYAFKNCTNLISADLSQTNLYSLSTGAFQGAGLKSIVLPTFLNTVLNKAFQNCTSLKSIEMPNIISLGSYAFDNCSNLESVKLGQNINSINSYCFRNCTKLNSVIYDKYVSTDFRIYSYAFENCISLTDYDFSRVIEIRDRAFKGCTGLTTLNFDRTLVNEIQLQAFKDCTNLESVNLERVKILGGNVFENCPKLSKVNLGNLITTLNSWTFHACTSLEEIEIPTSISSIVGSPFNNCSGLTSIKVISPNKSVYNSLVAIHGEDIVIEIEDKGEELLGGADHYYNWTYTEEKDGLIITKQLKTTDIEYPYTLTIPNKLLLENGEYKNVKEVKGDYISGLSILDDSVLSKVTKIIVSDGIEKIRSYAFGTKYTNKLVIESIEIPNSVTSLGESFIANTNIKKITLPNNIETLGYGAFISANKLEEVELPKSITKLEGRVFENCTKLSKINLENITSVGSNCFRYCNSLTSVELNAVDLLNGCFMDCPNLTSVTVSNKLETLIANSFKNCNLREFIVPNTVDNCTTPIFTGNNNLEKVYIEPTNTYAYNLIVKELGEDKVVHGLPTK